MASHCAFGLFLVVSDVEVQVLPSVRGGHYTKVWTPGVEIIGDRLITIAAFQKQLEQNSMEDIRMHHV